jgi:hypothetical protein
MKQIFYELFEEAEDRMSRKCCNDFQVPNTPEWFDLIEQYEMRNLRCKTIEEYRNHPDYEDYRPYVSKDGKEINTMDWIVLGCLKHILLEKQIIEFSQNSDNQEE